MNSEWLKHLRSPFERFSHMGIGTGRAALPLVELWGLYCYLSRLVDG